MHSKIGRLEQQCNRLYKELNKADDEVLDLKLERDMWKEEHEKVRQKYIDKDVELQIVDRIVLQYEQRLNDKIESLRSERENILSKMDRMEAQQLKLRDKINKLKEAKKALEILKEFK